MTDSRSHADVVDQLAEEFIARYRRGERPAVSDFAARCPDRAAEIRDLFPALVLMEQAASSDAASGHSHPIVEHYQQMRQLGDYRIIREVGRGGMGIVYEAEQLSLGRRVALKVLPHGLLVDKRNRQRFEREARAAARLHHTNIVPVFGVGEQEGLHYYVMQFIPGLGLDEVLTEVKRLRAAASATAAPPEKPEPAFNDVRSQLAAAVAGSLVSGQFELTRIAENSPDSSHQPTLIVDQPVEGSSDMAATGKRVPCDSSIAPGSPDVALRHTTNGRLSETMTGSAGFAFPGQSAADGRKSSRSIYWQSIARIGVQVAEALQYAHDQGIIHRDVKPANLLLDPQGTVWVTDFGLAKATDQQNLTHTGDVLGTLRYMAPEQFNGQSDPRSDQYALGMTLYELLALKPAFDETDRRKLIRQVTTGTPPRLRLLDPTIPRDLETIVHKAIGRDPAQRYETAGALAADLQRYLGDEAILARQPTIVQVVTKWCRRHRSAVTAGFAALILAVIGLSISTVLISKERDAAATAAQRADREAEGSRQAAERAHAAADREREAKQMAQRDRRIAIEERNAARYNLYVAHLHTAHADWKSGHTVRMLDTLQKHIPSPGQPDLRGWEWHYLSALTHQDLSTIETGSATVFQAAWSSDGRLLATNGGALKIWDPATSQLVSSVQVKGPYAWSPDGTRIAAIGEGGVLKLWDPRDSAEKFTLGTPAPDVFRIAWSADGRRLATGHWPGIVMLWDITPDSKPITLRGSVELVRSLAWSPDSRLLAVGDNFHGRLDVWDPVQQKLVQSHKAHDHYIHGLAWSPDGLSLATGSEDQRVKVWSTKTWECLKECWVRQFGDLEPRWKVAGVGE